MFGATILVGLFVKPDICRNKKLDTLSYRWYFDSGFLTSVYCVSCCQVEYIWHRAFGAKHLTACYTHVLPNYKPFLEVGIAAIQKGKGSLLL